MIEGDLRRRILLAAGASLGLAGCSGEEPAPSAAEPVTTGTETPQREPAAPAPADAREAEVDGDDVARDVEGAGPAGSSERRRARPPPPGASPEPRQEAACGASCGAECGGVPGED